MRHRTEEIRMKIRPLDIADTDVIRTGGGPDLLLLHSLLAERSVFDRILPKLAARFQLTVLNLPGYGATSPLPRKSPSIDDFADRIATIMDAARLPDDTAVLGNGAGGFIAAALGIRHGPRFGRLILADTGPGFPEPAKAPLRLLADKVEAEGMGAVLDAAIQRMFPASYITANPDVIAERKTALSATDPYAFAAMARALADIEMRHLLSRIENPTLVMVGLEDATTPPEMSRQLHAGIADSRLVEIPGCGHCPQIQAGEDFLRHVFEFLDE